MLLVVAIQLRAYLEIIALMGYNGKSLKEIETFIANKYGVSYNAVYKKIRRLKDEGLVKITKYGKELWVEPTPQLKQLIAIIEGGFPKKIMKRYLKGL